MTVLEPQALAEPVCVFCHAREFVALHEIWDDGRFMLATCCADQYDTIVTEMADDPAWARSLLQRLGAEAIFGHALRRVADDESGGIVLDWKLRIRDIAFADARAFVRRHHVHCNPPAAWRFGAACFNGRMMIGVAMVGNPVARALNGRGIVEVNRLCIRRDIPRPLAWNVASKLYGWSARTATQRGWQGIITYTRKDEDGGSLIAAGWTPDGVVRGRGWHGGCRARSNSNAFIDKTRWSKALRPRRQNRAAAQTRPARPHDCLTHALFVGREGEQVWTTAA